MAALQGGLALQNAGPIRECTFFLFSGPSGALQGIELLIFCSGAARRGDSTSYRAQRPRRLSERSVAHASLPDHSPHLLRPWRGLPPACARLRSFKQRRRTGLLEPVATSAPGASAGPRLLHCWRSGCGRMFAEGQGDVDDPRACGMCEHFAQLPPV